MSFWHTPSNDNYSLNETNREKRHISDIYNINYQGSVYDEI